MNKKIAIVLILVVIILGGYFLFKNPKAQAPSTETQTTTQTTGDTSNIITPESPTVITYTDTGYSPKALTIKLGETVTWANDSSLNMWTASAMHPSHIVYSGTSLSEHCPDTAGTSFDACKGTVPGGTWSFTFNKKGTWGYHDHLNPSNFGKIIVE